MSKLSALKSIGSQPEPEGEDRDAAAAETSVTGSAEDSATEELAFASPTEAEEAKAAAMSRLDNEQPNTKFFQDKAAPSSSAGHTASAEEDRPSDAGEPSLVTSEDASTEQTEDEEDIDPSLLRLIESIGIPVAEAQRLIAQHRHEQEELRERVSQEAEHRNYGGGSSLGSLLSLFTGGPRADATAEKVRLSERFRDRVYQVKRDQMADGMIAMSTAGDNVAASVEGFNNAFARTAAGSSFMGNVADYVASNGLDRQDVLDMVYKGTSTDPRLEAARKQLAAAFSDPAVEDAWNSMNRDVDAFIERAETMGKDFQAMHRNFPDKVDLAKAEVSIDKLFDDIQVKLPECIAGHPDESEKARIKERMQEISQKLREAIQGMIEKVASTLGLK